MSEVGATYSTFELRYDGLRKGVEQSIALLDRLEKRALDFEKRTKGIPGWGTAPAGGGGGGGGGGQAPRTSPEDRQKEREVRLAQQLENLTIRLATKQGDYARALGLVDAALENVSGDTLRQTNLLIRQEEILGRIARAEAQAARAAEQSARAQVRAAEQQTRARQQQAQQQAQFISSMRQDFISAQTPQRSGGGFGAQFGQGIAGALPFGFGAGVGFGAAQLAQTGLGAGFRALGSSYQLSATLDADRRALGAFLGSVEQGNSTMDAAARFAQRYGLRMSEVSEALRDAAPILKASTEPVEKQLEVLSRLGSRNRSEGVAGASFALNEAIAGDVTSLKERFNISSKAALELRDAVKAGADPIQALDQLLLKLGVTNEALRQQMEGPQGALREWQVAQERLGLSIGNFIDGPGERILRWASDVVTGFSASVDEAAKFIDKLDSAKGPEERGTLETAFRGSISVGPIGPGFLKGLDAFAQKGREAQAAAIQLGQGMSFQEGAAIRLAGALQDAKVKTDQLEESAKKALLSDLRGALQATAAQAQLVEAQLSALESQHISRLAGLRNQLRSNESNYGEQQARAASAFQQQQSRSDRDFYQSQSRAASAFQQQQAKAVRDFGQQQGRAAQQHAQQQAKASRDFNQQEAQSAAEHARKLVDIREDAARDIERLEKEHRQRIQDLQGDFDVESVRNREDFDERRRELLARGEVGEARRLERDFAKEQRRRQEDLARSKSGATDQFGEKVTDRRAQAQEQLQQEQQQYTQQREQRRVAFAQQQADAQASYLQQQADARQAFAQQQADARQSYAQQQAEAQSAHAQQQADARQSFAQQQADAKQAFQRQQQAIQQQMIAEAGAYAVGRAKIQADYQKFLEEQRLQLETEITLTRQVMAKKMTPEQAEWESVRQAYQRVFGQLSDEFARGGLRAQKAWLQGQVDAINDAIRPGGQYDQKLVDLKDRMVGQSPPPKGPLKTLDVGGFRVGQSWSQSFIRGIGGDIDPALSALRKNLGASAGGVGSIGRANGGGTFGRGGAQTIHAQITIPGRDVTLDGERIGRIAEERVAVAFDLLADATDQLTITATPGTGQKGMRGAF